MEAGPEGAGAAKPCVGEAVDAEGIEAAGGSAAKTDETVRIEATSVVRAREAFKID